MKVLMANYTQPMIGVELQEQRVSSGYSGTSLISPLLNEFDSYHFEVILP